MLVLGTMFKICNLKYYYYLQLLNIVIIPQMEYYSALKKERYVSSREDEFQLSFVELLPDSAIINLQQVNFIVCTVGILSLVNAKFVLTIPVCQHCCLFFKDMWGNRHQQTYRWDPGTHT